jgi:SAM-dependent methyltransferase
MAAVSGSTKPGADVTPRAGDDGRADAPSATPLILDPSGLPRALHDTSTSGLALEALCDRLAGEIILRHAVGRSTLDLGHGAPRVAQWVRPRASSLTIVDAIDLGRGAAIRLPWRDDSFECAYSLRTLPHLGHDGPSSDAAARSLLVELSRVLKPGGVAVCQIDNPRSLWGAYHGIRHPKNVIERGPLVVESERGVTRFDTLPRLLEMLPTTLAPSDVHGLRVFTAWPHVLAMPFVGRLFARLEWFARDRAMLRGFGAHLLVVLRRTR